MSLPPFYSVVCSATGVIRKRSFGRVRGFGVAGVPSASCLEYSIIHYCLRVALYRWLVAMLKYSFIPVRRSKHHDAYEYVFWLS